MTNTEHTATHFSALLVSEATAMIERATCKYGITKGLKAVHAKLGTELYFEAYGEWELRNDEENRLRDAVAEARFAYRGVQVQGMSSGDAGEFREYVTQALDNLNAFLQERGA
jgi:hypothetical protein